MYTKVYMFVSNSSTIILITKATLFQKFLDTVNNICISNIVYEEIFQKNSFENLLIKKEVEKGRIKVCIIKEKFFLGLITQFKIDLGEASTFALFRQNVNDAILTDDKELMKLCKINGVPFISAMAIAVILFKKKVISNEEALDKLENIQGYGRYSKEVYDYFKGMVR